jgi:lipopolysaccharide/colanic/teichoic acid biosynthesis glycosyltransferase
MLAFLWFEGSDLDRGEERSVTWYRMSKRLLDLGLSLFGLIMLGPLLGMVALAVVLDTPGPVFYKGSRIGKGGMPFRILKFRTMVVDADRAGPPLTSGGDPRVTRVGRLLRKLKIDELPQLLNVLCGEMTLVGPRPECPDYVAFYTPQQRHVLDVKPGITGLTQIRFRNEEVLLRRCPDAESVYVETIMPYKLSVDLTYIAQRSFLLDLRLIGETVACLFRTSEPEIVLPAPSSSEAPVAQ